MLDKLKKVVPAPLWYRLTRLWESAPVRRLRYFGFAHYCPICRSHVKRYEDYGKLTILKEEE